MRIGLAGAHGVGKSTIAKSLADIYGLTFITSAGAKTIKKFNFDMEHDNRLETGMKMQAEQLSAMIDELQGKISYVSDRTPIDAAAYLLADATAPAGSIFTQMDTVMYVEQAMELTAEHFDLVILVPPAIDFVEREGRAPQNEAYREHLHMLCRGMLFDDEVSIPTGQLLRTNIDHGHRVQACVDFIDRYYVAKIAA